MIAPPFTPRGLVGQRRDSLCRGGLSRLACPRTAKSAKCRFQTTAYERTTTGVPQVREGCGVRTRRTMQDRWVHNEDCVRQVLRRCSPAAVTLFSGTCRANLATAREEPLWELLSVRSGLRYRPAHWAASSAAGDEDELEPDSWRLAFVNHAFLVQGRAPELPGGLLSPRKFRVCSGALELPEALSLALDGDTVELQPGSYPPVVLSRAISLIGSNRDCVEVRGISVQAEGVTVAGLTIFAGKADAPPEAKNDVSAIRMLCGSARILDCNIRGHRGIEVAKGATAVLFSCDVEAQTCCFQGAGELDSCRLQGMKTLSNSDAKYASVVDFRQGNSRLKNCIVDGRDMNVGLKLRCCASVEVLDSDITARHYGISTQGCQHQRVSTSVLVHNSRSAVPRRRRHVFTASLVWCLCHACAVSLRAETGGRTESTVVWKQLCAWKAPASMWSCRKVKCVGTWSPCLPRAGGAQSCEATVCVILVPPRALALLLAASAQSAGRAGKCRWPDARAAGRSALMASGAEQSAAEGVSEREETRSCLSRAATSITTSEVLR